MRKNAQYIFIVGLILLLYGALQMRPVRWDLTDDKHYSLSEASKTLLRQTDSPVEVTLLLDGDLNAGFRRLKKAAEETLAEMGVFGQLNIKNYELTSSSTDSLNKIGLRPIVIHEREQNGKTAQTTIYPYALMCYKGRQTVVSLLKNTRGLSGEENLNASIEQLEFAFMEALQGLTRTETPRIAILEGHNEPDEAHTYDLMTALSKYFQVDRGSLDERPINIHLLDGYKAVLVISPQTAFSDAERFIIDQYIMRGGTVLWSLDGVRFSEDVLQQDGFTPIVALDLGLTEMLFHYGVRINSALVQDIQCLSIPVNVSTDPQQPAAYALDFCSSVAYQRRLAYHQRFRTSDEHIRLPYRCRGRRGRNRETHPVSYQHRQPSHRDTRGSQPQRRQSRSEHFSVPIHTGCCIIGRKV